MAKFHLNDKGEPGPCRAAQGGCPFGGDEAHYGSKAEAQAAYEKAQGKAALAGVSKPGGVKLPRAVTHARSTDVRTITPEREAFYAALLARESGETLTTMSQELAAAYQAVPYHAPEAAQARLANTELAKLSPLAQSVADQHDLDDRGQASTAYGRLRAAYIDSYNLSRYKLASERRAAAKPVQPYTAEDRAAIQDALANIDFPRGVPSGQGATPKNAVERLALGMQEATAEGWDPDEQSKFHSSYALKQLEKQRGVVKSSAYSRLLGAINDEDSFEAVMDEPEVQKFLADGVKGKRLFQNSNVQFDRAVVGEAFRVLGPARAGKLLNEVNGKAMSIIRFFGEIEALEPR